MNLSKSQQELFNKFGFAEKVKTPFKQIHFAFEKQVKLHPNAIAVEHLNQKITYQELNKKANLLAQYLKEKGVKKGDNVGLFLERSIPMIIGMLAILKSKAAYVPQDARITPASQLQYIINTAKISLVLTLSHLESNIPSITNCVSIDSLLQNLENSKRIIQHDKNNIYKDGGNCFILFTSGTTGLPNGVNVTHKNVCNILLNSPGNLGIQAKDKVSQILNISFDMAAWEIWGALSHGASLVIRGKNIEKTVSQVNIAIATPSILSSIDEKKCKKIRVIAVAGEPCPKPLADKWSKFCTFYNSCGPTEVTIVNTMKRYIACDGKITIGRPTPNNTVYILNEELKACKIGEMGEMWAGGDCVTEGYINNEKLTRKRYKPDPFLGKGHFMFRTRDLGRWTANGELEHFGRTDDQVKVKGFRVELDSISSTLESMKSCQQATTLKLDSNNLVSFVSPITINIEELIEKLKEKLPYFYIPSLVIALKDFPKTIRGKIDKKVLTTIAVENLESISFKNKEFSA